MAVRRFLSLSGRERALRVQAVLVLPLVALGLKVRGYEGTRRWVERLGGHHAPALDPDADIAAAVRSVTSATSRLPMTATCLARSLTLWLLLRRRGIDGEVVMGVRPGGDPIDAHAWLERDGIPLDESQDVVDTYARL